MKNIRQSNKSQNGKFLKFLLIIVVIIVILSIFSTIENKKTDIPPVKTTPTLIYDGREFTSNWSDEVNENFIEIQKLLVQNRIQGCGEFYYNEIENKTYIIGCTADGENYIYYVAWTRLNKIYSLDSSMLTIFTKPNEVKIF